jgi:N-acetyl-gamma-glutamyl-phosphate/LysW-gamma-L-alpha-aminoadipyl-6-phosphate reductase
MSRTIHAAILGGTGYGAGELLRLLTQHPHVQVVSVTSTSQVGQPIASVHPHLAGFYDGLRLAAEIDFPRLLAGEHAVVFSSLPHGASGPAIEVLLEQQGRSLSIIDLSGDLRIRDRSLHARYYPDGPALPRLRGDFVYGLPELNRSAIAAARRVANPGCLATAVILAGAPLIDAQCEGLIVADVKTGSSGSGRALKETTHHPTRHADFRAYRPLAHQHEGEILQAWGDPHGRRIRLSFVAQSMDTARGVFASVHLMLPEPTRTEELRMRYERFYAGCPFVRLRSESPTLQDVVGSNFCDIAVACRDRQVLAMAALDNLIKGMSGAAIQNMNLMCGLPETTGLWMPALRPV